MRGRHGVNEPPQLVKSPTKEWTRRGRFACLIRIASFPAAHTTFSNPSPLPRNVVLWQSEKERSRPNALRPFSPKKEHRALVTHFQRQLCVPENGACRLTDAHGPSASYASTSARRFPASCRVPSHGLAPASRGGSALRLAMQRVGSVVRLFSVWCGVSHHNKQYLYCNVL